MKIKRYNTFICDLHDVVHIRTLKQALNHGLILEKVHRVIQFNQEAWLKPNIEMNIKTKNRSKE